MYDDANPKIRRLRKLCLALPGAIEKEAWGECTFRVEGGSMFAMTNNDPQNPRVVEVWIKSSPLEQEILIGASPETFFKPPYVGPKGWVGVRLDRSVDWAQVADLLREGHRMSAPKKPRSKARP
jgi:predicted DNA-binding protein (MmcQ/YjbR family)